MKKVAIFGNAGGGKSTLARRLGDVTNLPLYSVDKIKFRPGGEAIPYDDYLNFHSELLNRQEWIIDGFGCDQSAWQRFEVADTLIHIDLPLLMHGVWVTKRLIKGLFVNPEGWPENSPIVKSSLSSYRVLWPCHVNLTPKYRRLIADSKGAKQVYHLTSLTDIRGFLNDIGS